MSMRSVAFWQQWGSSGRIPEFALFLSFISLCCFPSTSFSLNFTIIPLFLFAVQPIHLPHACAHHFKGIFQAKKTIKKSIQTNILSISLLSSYACQISTYTSYFVLLCCFNSISISSVIFSTFVFIYNKVDMKIETQVEGRAQRS